MHIFGDITLDRRRVGLQQLDALGQSFDAVETSRTRRRLTERFLDRFRKLDRQGGLQPGVPMIVLETALPIKFAATIEEALGQTPPRPARFEGIEALPKRVKLLPADAAAIKRYIAENVH